MVRLSLALVIAFLGPSCASTAPETRSHSPYQERAVTEVRGGVSVTVALPTAEEAEALYGVDLTEKKIQPVWIKVKNDTAKSYWFLSSGLDANYFSTSEAAYAFRATGSDGGNRALIDRFEGLQFKNPIGPGTTVSGFLLTNLDEGMKGVDVDLVTLDDAKSFTFVVADPTFRSRGSEFDLDKLYNDSELVHVDNDDRLRMLLEQLPCCTTNSDGSAFGDPLNLVMIGSRSDLVAAFVRRQWHPTEVIHAESVWRTIKSFIQETRYRYSPISPLYVFGRPQDGAAQKARSTIHERNHARFWLSRIRFRGKKVWVGQISRDIGVKFTIKSPTISTHVVDPDVDEARRYMIEDLAYSQALHRIGYVKGVGAASRSAPRFNLVDDPYYTDGLRAVMFFEPRPFSLSDLEFLDWERPPRAGRSSKSDLSHERK
jgi:hypothetical protein